MKNLPYKTKLVSKLPNMENSKCEDGHKWLILTIPGKNKAGLPKDYVKYGKVKKGEDYKKYAELLAENLRCEIDLILKA